MKRDRTLVRGSKHSVRLLYPFSKFAIFVDRNGSYLLESGINRKGIHHIDYEYPIFSLAQIRSFAVKDMKRPSDKHGSIVHTTLGNMAEFQLEKRLLYTQKHISRKPKFYRFQICKIQVGTNSSFHSIDRETSL